MHAYHQTPAVLDSDDAENEPPQLASTQKSDSHNSLDQGVPAHSTLLSASPTTAGTLQSLSSLTVTASRPFPAPEVEIHDTIIEEDDETDYDTPNEPVTPVSGRQSREAVHGSESASIAAPLAKTHSSNGETAADSLAPADFQPHLAKSANSVSQNSIPRLQRHRRTLSSNSDAAEPVPIPAGNSSFIPIPARSTGTNVADYPGFSVSPSPPTGLYPETPFAARPETAVSGSFTISPSRITDTNGAATDGDRHSSVFQSPSSDALHSPVPARRQSRNNSFKRTMSSLFRRADKQAAAAATAAAAPSANSNRDYSQSPPDGDLEMRATPRRDRAQPRRWSTHRERNEKPLSPTHSNGQSAAIPLPAKENDAAGAGNASGMAQSMPSQIGFAQSLKSGKAGRSATFFGHSFTGSDRKTKKMAQAGNDKNRRRASSFDKENNNLPGEMSENILMLTANAGTGLKARRLSLSLPDDFNVDVITLQDEYEYKNILGRRGPHIGKGATSKVALMVRKGFANEVYAVKEFRGKSQRETAEEYEKKVKSEYSISKSLHHPNIVETINLCTDHGRWNHVMEYCAEGDLFSLVTKKMYCGPEREKDRLCLFRQLIQGVNYLHSHGVAHRDIKLENLLLTSNSKLKIADFGASDVFSGEHPGLRGSGGLCDVKNDSTVRLCRPGVCGSLPYISPEVLANDEPYDPRKLDVWSTAFCMVTMVSGGHIWEEARYDENHKGTYYALVKGWNKFNAKQKKAEQEAQEAAAAAAAAAKSGDAPASAAPLAPISANVPAPATDDATGRPVVRSVANENSNPNAIVEGQYPFVNWMDQFINPPILRRVLVQMLNPDPAKRPTIDQIANLRYIRGIECCQADLSDEAMISDEQKRGCIDASRSASNLQAKLIYCHDHIHKQQSTLMHIV